MMGHIRKTPVLNCAILSLVSPTTVCRHAASETRFFPLC